MICKIGWLGRNPEFRLAELLLGPKELARSAGVVQDSDSTTQIGTLYGWENRPKGRKRRKKERKIRWEGAD